MAREFLANDATSTLSAAIVSTSATTLAVTSATGFPATGTFRVLVDAEIMQVTGVSGTTFTVVRGVEGTTAATHSSGATIANIVTAAGLLAAGATNTASSYTLSSGFTFTAASTYQNTGATLTLPETGTYLLFGSATSAFDLAGSNNATCTIKIQLYDATNSIAASNTPIVLNGALQTTQSSPGTNFQGSGLVGPSLYTPSTTPATINLQARYDTGGGGTESFASVANAQIAAIRIY